MDLLQQLINEVEKMERGEIREFSYTRSISRRLLRSINHVRRGQTWIVAAWINIDQSDPKKEVITLQKFDNHPDYKPSQLLDHKWLCAKYNITKRKQYLEAKKKGILPDWAVDDTDNIKGWNFNTMSDDNYKERLGKMGRRAITDEVTTKSYYYVPTGKKPTGRPKGSKNKKTPKK